LGIWVPFLGAQTLKRNGSVLLRQVRPPASAEQAWATGVVWLVLTVSFETAMGRFLQHRSWRDICRDYNLFAGRVWVLFLVWLALAPYVFYRLCFAV
jgi:hypothetical protein